MDRGSVTAQNDLNHREGLWSWQGSTASEELIAEIYSEQPAAVAPAALERETQRAERPGLETAEREALSLMTVAEFVERKFLPEYVVLKGSSGKMHYQAMLKHVLRPEEVNGLFRQRAGGRRNKLSSVAGWPYLGAMRLRDVSSQDVQRLIDAALQRGYSTQTATHILNVVSAIFSHARQVHYLFGDNPVRQVKRWEVTRKAQLPLRLDQIKLASEIMKNPEREMMLVAILTGLNVSEICGLQWKHVNLSDRAVSLGAEQIPPRTIAIRRQWFRGEPGAVKRGRMRNVPIPAALMPVFRDLKSRSRFLGQEDFMLVSRVGTPVNHANILVRRLKPMARQIGVPSLSWHVLQTTRKALSAEFGRRFHDSMMEIVEATSPLPAAGNAAAD